MKRQRFLYSVLVAVCSLFILYAIIKNYVVDPNASAFLSHKTGLKRELNLPAWLNVMYVHVAFACLAMGTGLLNFSNRIFRKSRRFHRINGYVYLMSVFLVVLTSGYLAPYSTGGKMSSIGFNALNLIWPFITVMAVIGIRKKQIGRHRDWMIRSYAFCFTNLSIHLLASLFQYGFGFSYSASYTLGIYGSIILLLAIPEVLIRSLFPPAKPSILK
ncbi:hypothetical protein AWM70_07530 [Paenibacillus yonginensis]|uniref:DUF2306 domain-containing protein n=1 Tax=Paenibacillus yonginensis TaxID=1462996 RepID=A0A1B1MZ45_9BACL|nr:DUF2306 domain-containing protein [Paenibacillus yonginensis]ANS74450.1 hypothetical protein AWM70_07530 [Paenibacillus yonginensis]